jgi:hypothetical protein
VDDVSSEVIRIERSFMIDTNYIGMCRYSSKEDDRYKQVSHELRILCEDIDKILKEKDVLKYQQR